MLKTSILIIPLLLTLALPVAAQDVYVGCTDDELTRQQETFALFLTLDFANNRDMALANLFRLGAIYQSMALDCGYAPNQAEVNVMLEQALDFASLDDLILAQSVGVDVEEILAELDEVYGDPLRGQLLYNGLEPALGGSPLGCAGCHENRGDCAVNRRHLDADQRNSVEAAAIRRLCAWSVFGGEHRAAARLYHAGIYRGNAGILWRATDDSATGRFGGVFG